MSLTTDRNDPDLGVPRADGQNKKYLVLSKEETAKGYVKPFRDAYIHDGPHGPKYPLRDLTSDEHRDYDQYLYFKYEEYPKGSACCGKYWTQKELDRIAKGGCKIVTTMGHELSATYARDPEFYDVTYCCGCGAHYPLNEFHWTADGEPMDPKLQEAWAEEQKKKRDAQRAMKAEWDTDRLTRIEKERVGAALLIGRQQYGTGYNDKTPGLAEALARIEKLELDVLDLKSKQDQR